MRQVERFGDGPGDERHQEILRGYSDDHVTWSRDENAKVFFRKSQPHREHDEAENRGLGVPLNPCEGMRNKIREDGNGRNKCRCPFGQTVRGALKERTKHNFREFVFIDFRQYIIKRDGGQNTFPIRPR